MAGAKKQDVVSRIVFALGLFLLSMALMLVNVMLIPEDKRPSDFVDDLTGDCDRELAVAVHTFYAGGAQCYTGDLEIEEKSASLEPLCELEHGGSSGSLRPFIDRARYGSVRRLDEEPRVVEEEPRDYAAQILHDRDDYDEPFVDAHGRTCGEWLALGCDGGNTTHAAAYSEDELKAVHSNCPACCRLSKVLGDPVPDYSQPWSNYSTPQCASRHLWDGDRDSFTLKDFVGEDAQKAKQCSKAVIEERAFDIATGFLEFHIGVLLLFVYTLHMVTKAMKKVGVRQACGKLLFVFCLLVETILVARFVFWVEDFAPLDGSDWKWERLGGDDYLDKMLNYNAPFNDVMWQTLMWALGIRLVGFLFCMGMVICDARFADDEEGTETSSENKIISAGCVRAVHDVYVFTFIVLMTSCGMVTLYFFWQSESDEVEFSYLAGTECENVQGLTAAEFKLQPLVDHRCVRNLITMRDRDTVRSLFSVYATILIFYMLTIAEAMDFIEEISQKWFPWTRLYVAVIAILEVLVFIAKIQTYFETDDKKSLKHNNPKMEFYNGLLVQTMVFRSIAMAGVMVLYSAARCEGDPKEDTEGEKKFVTKNKKGNAPVTAAPATPAVVLNAA